MLKQLKVQLSFECLKDRSGNARTHAQVYFDSIPHTCIHILSHLMYEELLFHHSLHIALMHKHHGHQMYTVDHNVCLYLLIFPMDLNADVT